MLYHALRESARLALRWHYGEVLVQGGERIPRDAPVLFVANHPNALVDALVVAVSTRRRIWLTAKATLFEHGLLAPLLHAVGVVPLRRAADERKRADRVAVGRNEDAFKLVSDTLLRRRAVLVFPEGISHDEPALAPLRTGAARMALAGRAAGAAGVTIVPVGLVFEAKEKPRSRVLVRIGEPVAVDVWAVEHPELNPAVLTALITERLGAVTLNFPSTERAARAVGIARALAATTVDVPDLASGPSLAVEAEIASRVEAATAALEYSSPAIITRTDDFLERVARLDAALQANGVALQDAMVSPGLYHGARFVVREGLLLLASVPVALLGWAVHLLPVRLARALAMRSLRGDPSRDQPAMRTIVIGLGVVLLWYVLQAYLAMRWGGPWAAIGWTLLIGVAAQLQLVLFDRIGRAWRRARTYLVMRGSPAFREHVVAELHTLRDEAVALEALLLGSPGG